MGIPGQDDTPMGSSEPSQRWQQMEATDASHLHIATHDACDAEGNDPGQALHHYVCDAEGDNTSLARHLHHTPAKPRDDPGQTPHRNRPRERLPDKKIFHYIKPFS